MSFAFNCVHRRAIDRHVGSGALVAKAPPPAPPPRHPHPPPFPPSPLFLLLLSFYILRFTFTVYLFRSPVNARDIRRHECKIYLCTICTSPIRGSDSHLYLIFPVHRRWQSLFLLLFFPLNCRRTRILLAEFSRRKRTRRGEGRLNAFLNTFRRRLERVLILCGI